MDPVDNNQFEVKPTTKSKRKIATLCPNVYLNPALDLLANEDPICNTAMEIVPVKKRKRTRSLDTAAFENSALDLGISKAAVNEFLMRELDNVRKNFRKVQNLSQTDLSNVDLNLSEVTSRSLDDITVKFNKKGFYGENSEVNYGNLSNINIVGLPEMPCINDVSMDVEMPGVNTQDFENINVPIVESIKTENATVISHIPTNNTHIDTASGQAFPVFENTVTENCMIVTENPSNAEMEIKTDTQDLMEVSRIDELDSGIAESKSLNTATTSALNNLDLSAINATSIQTHVTNQIFINNNGNKNDSNLSLSFIDRLGLDSPNLDSLCFDDDLNESNIMEIKTITIITKKKRIPEKKKCTNPFLDPNLNINHVDTKENPFLDPELSKPELEYTEEAINKTNNTQVAIVNPLMPRRLFANETNSTFSTMNDSANTDQHLYENVDMYRSESPIYENVCDESDEISNDDLYNKQSRVLGHDVSRFSAVDIMNINKNSRSDCSNDSNESKKDLKHHLLKAGNKLSKKVFKTLKKKFKSEKTEPNVTNVTLNPYEVPRKTPKQKSNKKESGIENPALNLDGSDEIDIEEIEDDEDEEHQYETIKTLRNTRLNMNVTPLKERNVENVDISHNRTNTPGKKVRFDSTLNQEKVITGNSFDYDLQSPGFDSKIDKYHDELENCINEKKFLQQNM